MIALENFCQQVDFGATEGPSRAEHAQPSWYAAHVRSRHEKQVARHLEQRNINCFLPLYRSQRVWKDRRKELNLVLFPGYIFIQLDLRDRLHALSIPGMIGFIACNSRPVPVAEAEIEPLRRGFQEGIWVQPHPFLSAGHKVRVFSGPLAGAEGIVVRRKNQVRLVISIDLIMRSVVVEVDEADLQPL